MTDVRRRTSRRSTSSDEPSGSPRWVLDSSEPYALVPRAAPPASGVVWADMPRRGVAFALDLVMLLSVTTMLLQMSAFIAGATLLTSGGVTDRPLGAWLGFAFPTLVVAFLEGVVYTYFWHVYRASPGQLILDLNTVRAADGGPLPRARAGLRWLVTFMPIVIIASASNLSVIWVVLVGKSSDDQGSAGFAITLPLIWYAVIAISAVLDARGRGLNDRLARSVVVRRER